MAKPLRAIAKLILSFGDFPETVLEKKVRAVEDGLRKRADAGDVGAMIFWLKCRVRENGS